MTLLNHSYSNMLWLTKQQQKRSGLATRGYSSEYMFMGKKYISIKLCVILDTLSIEIEVNEDDEESRRRRGPRTK